MNVYFIMKSQCCIGDANISPRNSSYSMTLRSDCSHGYPRKYPLVTKEHNEVSHTKRKVVESLTREKLHDSNSSTISYNSSEVFNYHSWKKFELNSTYLFLKERLCGHFDYSKAQRDNSTNQKVDVTNFHAQLQNSVSAPLLNNNSLTQEEWSYLKSSNWDTNTLDMSRFNESRSRSAVNALSESETEDDQGIVMQENVRRKRSNKTSRHRSTQEKSESLITNNNSNHISTRNSYQETHTHQLSHNSHTPISSSAYETSIGNIVYKADNHKSGNNVSVPSSPSSPVIDISTVQHSPIDRFRWFLWSSIYLKTIKCVNFDVWLLSRLHKYRMLIILLLLLPFLAYLSYGGQQRQPENLIFSDIMSNIDAFTSYIYSIISRPILYKPDVSDSSEKTSSSNFYSIFFSILNYLSSLLAGIGNFFSISNGKGQTTHKVDSTIDKDQFKLIAIQAAEEKFQHIMEKIQLQFKEAQFKVDSLNKLQNDISSLRSEFQSLTESVQKLEQTVTKNSKGMPIEHAGLGEKHFAEISSLNIKMKEFEEKFSILGKTSKSCCDEKWTLADFTTEFEKHFLAALKNMVVSNENNNSPYIFFKEWLKGTQNAHKEELSNELKIELHKLNKANFKIDESSRPIIEKVVQQYLESSSKHINTIDTTAFSFEDAQSVDVMKKLIKEAILLYDADKTGLVDYALESGGGSVLSTRCSENYAEKDGTISILGFSLWSAHNSPRTAIQPDVQPGKCWAFKGSQGFLVIQLSYTIHPTGFTLEHIPLSLSPSGSLDSAPKDFSVWGLLSEKDNEGILLGKYTYDQYGDPLQYFPVENKYKDPFSFIELKINSNHGNLDYTCLYRFRVHGNKPKL